MIRPPLVIKCFILFVFDDDWGPLSLKSVRVVSRVGSSAIVLAMRRWFRRLSGRAVRVGIIVSCSRARLGSEIQWSYSRGQTPHGPLLVFSGCLSVVIAKLLPSKS